MPDRPNPEETAMSNFSPDPPAPFGAPTTHSEMIDAAYLQFHNREKAGEKVDPEDFCRDYPGIQASLLRLVQIHQVIEQELARIGAKPRVWPQLGTNYLNRFVLLHEIGQGAFSRVYLANDGRVGKRWVVIKVSPHGSSEAQILGRIEHPNIVEIHSVENDEENRLSALCMPLQGYATLLEVLDHVRAAPAIPKEAAFLAEVASRRPVGLPAVQRDRPASPRIHHDGPYVDSVRQLAMQLLDALAQVHEHGIVHSDLKPSNILLTPAGAPLLLDFNLADDAKQDLVRLGGTLFYMSPEQIEQSLHPENAAKLTPRSDLYSLGVILFELLTGKHPFGPLSSRGEFDELRRQLQARQQTAKIDVRADNPDVDVAFAEFIERCLSPDPSRRPVAAQSALVPLRKAAEPKAELPPKPRWQRPRRVLAAGAVALLAIFAIGWLVQTPKPSDFELGRKAGQEQRWVDAVSLYANAMETHQDKFEVYQARGMAKLRIAEQNGGLNQLLFRDAAFDLSQVDESRPSAESKSRLAYARLGSGDYPNAKLLYEEAVRHGSNKVADMNNLGLTLQKLGKGQDAIDQFTKALKQFPGHPTLHHNRAIASLSKSMTISPGNDAKKRGLLTSAEADCVAALQKTQSGQVHHDLAVIRAGLHEKDPPSWHLVIKPLEDAIKHGLVQEKWMNEVVFPAEMRNAGRFELLAFIQPGDPKLYPAKLVISPLDD